MPQPLRRRIEFQLPSRPPLDWASLLAFLAARAIPRVEAVDNDTYRRTFAVNGLTGVVCVSPAGREGLRVSLPMNCATALPWIRDRVRRMFDIDAEPLRIAEHFSADPLLAPLIAKWPGVRIPGAWDAFEIAMRAVVGQQISVAGARTILGRIAAKYGTRVDTDGELTVVFPEPAKLARSRVGGMPASRAATIRAIAAAYANGEPPIDVLTGVRGVGPWTASYVAMRSFADRDAFPSGDLGLRKAVGGMSAAELERISERWRPYRAYAAILLWRSL